MNITMKFYLAGLGNLYPNLDTIQEAIIAADEVGFDGALIPDHYMWGEMRGGHRMPNPYSTLEAWISLTYLAGKTEQISLGTLVTPIPFRPPAMLAKMLSTLDVLSKGRVIFGVGAGWSQVEFEGYSTWDGPKVRVDKTLEGLKLMIKLWTEEHVTFNGRFYNAKGAVLDPKPVQKPYPKLLFGGVGKRMLRMAGRYADIVYLPPWVPGTFEEAKNIVSKAAEKVGRANKVSFMSGAMGSRESYNSKQYKSQVDAAAEEGAEYYLTTFLRGPGMIKSVKKFAKDVIPSYQ